MTEIKKIIERFQLDQFIEVSGMPIEVLREGKAGNEPDFICFHNGCTLGIEVRALKNTRISKEAGIQRQVVAKAQKLAIDHGMKPIRVRVLFGGPTPNMRGNKKDDAAEYLYRIIYDNLKRIQDGHGYPVIIDTGGNRCGVLHMYANWGEMDGKVGITSHSWSTNELHWVISKFPQELQNAIDCKNKKYDSYTRAVHDCWLLLVVDRSKKDEPFDYSQMDQSINYDSKFNKIFLLDLMERKHYELHPVNRC
jgi:hypothetical protein